MVIVHLEPFILQGGEKHCQAKQIPPLIVSLSRFAVDNSPLWLLSFLFLAWTGSISLYAQSANFLFPSMRSRATALFAV